MQGRLLKPSVIALAIALGGFGGEQIAARLVSPAHAEATTTAAVRPPLTAPTPASAVAQAMPNFRAIVARYGPAVVNISVEGTVKAGARSPFAGVDPDDPFYEFFRRFGPQFQAPQGEQVVRGMGSGFIVSPDGVVLTNAHVVADASRVTVKLTDKREFKAKVVGVDKQSDIAVLRIDARDLPTVPLGDPADTQVGDWVLAIGSPFGFENSVTAGIVSAKSRSLPEECYVPFIQTDVAVNPGNSGGPLLNLKGEVVGINSQIYSRSGGYQGLSFAIPINVAAQVKDQLLAHGKVTRGRLGVSVQGMNQALAQSFGLPSAQGALVGQVEKGSSAAKAGLEPGDVILSFNGQKIGDANELPTLVAATAPGASAQIEIWRNGEKKSVKAVIGEQKAERLAAADKASGDLGKLGVAVRALTPEEKKSLDAAGGVLVVEVGGPAARAGIRPDDVILAVNGHSIGSPDDLKRRVASSGEHAALLVQRDDARIFVPVDLG
jgi:serine protease Do